MKVAFFDIDGTLIDVGHGLNRPTQETLDALKAFQKRGNKIIVASARGTLPEGVDDINFDGYICSDGHYIKLDGEILVDQLFNHQQVQKQIEIYKKYRGRPMFYGHDYTWCDCYNDELVKKHQMMFQGNTDIPDNAYQEYQAKDVHAISCCVLFENKEDLWNAYHELENDFTIVPYESGLIRMDVYCQGFKKGTACQYVYEKLGIDYECTYAFGDGINDLEMFQLVKHSVAMGNAVEELKMIASEQTDTVLNNGIAKYLNKHI